MRNPFNITKAVDYSDKELNDFWVDFPGVGFNDFIKPTLDMPMIILGSKGSGKTHIMKHFSYTMQKIRHKEEIVNGILEDGYFGTYLRCSGLNAYKFNGRGETEETWETFFSYYLELWLGQLILNNICKLINGSNLIVEHKPIIKDILSLFDSAEITVELDNLDDLRDYLNHLQKNIDYSINNRAFTKKPISESVEVLLSPGSLIFGIPEILSLKIPELKDIKFLYLLDEYENFTFNQQKYFNTLIRERKNPVCFKIGSRRYGIRTKKTLSANEEIKLGSEYDQIDIDDIFRRNKNNFKIFIKSICLKRLRHLNIVIDEDRFEDYFEGFDEEKLIINIKSRGRKHLDKLVSELKNHGFKNEYKTIISNIRFSSNIVLERANIMLLHRSWKSGGNLVKESVIINTLCKSYYKNPNKDSHHGRLLNKHRLDIIDALQRENNLKVESYIGFNNLIRVSNGIPRHFLIIMKHIYRWNEYLERRSFISLDEKISSSTQLNAINDTSSWFVEDAKIPGNNGNQIKDCIERLCDYMRELRFSSLPPECSISSFSIDSKVIPSEIDEIINFLEQYSYIIKIDSGRRNKNLNSRNHTYQINGLLSAQWELSLARRGIVDFNLAEITAIFMPKDDRDYKNVRSKNLLKYNVPFSSKSSNPSLFDLI